MGASGVLRPTDDATSLSADRRPRSRGALEGAGGQQRADRRGGLRRRQIQQRPCAAVHHRRPRRRLPGDRRAGRDRHRHPGQHDRADLRGNHPDRFVRRSRQQRGHAHRTGRAGRRDQHVRGIRRGHQAGRRNEVLPAAGRERGGEQGRQGPAHGHERTGHGRGGGLEHRGHVPPERQRRHELERRHQRGEDRRPRARRGAGLPERAGGGRKVARGDLRRGSGRQHDTRPGVRPRRHGGRHGPRHRRDGHCDDLRCHGDREAGPECGHDRDGDGQLHPAGRRRAGGRKRQLGGRLLRPVGDPGHGDETVRDGSGDHLDPVERHGRQRQAGFLRVGRDDPGPAVLQQGGGGDGNAAAEDLNGTELRASAGRSTSGASAARRGWSSPTG